MKQIAMQKRVHRDHCLILVLLFASTALAAPSASAQSFTVVHAFSGGGDGYWPYAGVTIDQGGNLYGTTTQYIGGTVYEIRRHNGWVLNTLYQFPYGESIPQGRVVQGPGGALYVTSNRGGDGFCTEFGCGTVTSIRPPQTFCRTFTCPWSGTLSYSFTGPDGFAPGFVDPVFDSAGHQRQGRRICTATDAADH